MNVTETDAIVGLIVVPAFLGLVLYMSVALFVWPIARPLVPLTILLLFLFLPPLFPFLVLYLLFVSCSFGLRRPDVVREVVVVEPSTRGRVRPVVTSRSGNRV